MNGKGVVALRLSYYFVCICRLSMVGFAVSLADSDTFAAKSILELVANHCSEPFIPLSDLIPRLVKFVLPVCLVQFWVG